MTEKMLFGGETLTDTSKADIQRGYAVLAEEPVPSTLFPAFPGEPGEDGFLSRGEIWER